MKKWLLVAAAFLIIIAMAAAGCSPPAADPEPQPGESGIEPETETVAYEAWEDTRSFPEEISETMQDIIQNLKGKRGYYAFSPQDFQTGEDLFILISSGEKPSGGYSATVQNVAAKNNTLEITVEEREPSQEKYVIAALTYPLVLLKVQAGYDFFTVTNTAGDTFPPIFPQEIPENDEAERENVNLSAAGILVGRIDSNSVEININGEPRAFYLDEQTLIDNLTDGENITFEYYEDQYGRLIINKIEQNI